MDAKKKQIERVHAKLVVKQDSQLPHGQFEAILSTDDLDRHGEHVAVDGVEIPKGRTIKMYYNHETTGEKLPIGKWLKIWKKDGKLYGQGQIDMEDEFAVKVYKKVLGGFLDSISIGFYPLEFDGDTSTWTKSTLVEASVVAEPANTSAVITSKKLDFTEDEFQDSLKQKLDKSQIEKITVKILNKGEVEDMLTEPQKWELMKDFYDVMYAFERVYYKDETPAGDFKKLLAETIVLLQQIVDGTYEYTDKQAGDVNGAGLPAEVKSVIDELKSRVGALEAAGKAASEEPTTKQLIRVRVAAKQVDKSADRLNQVIKVQLKENQ